MNNPSKIIPFKSLSDIAVRLRSDLKDLDFVLLYAYNGTGKTRLSMEFKDRGKKKVGETNGIPFISTPSPKIYSTGTTISSPMRIAY